MASMYAVYHGPDGLRRIAEDVHGRATGLARHLQAGGVEVEHELFFDTVRALVPGRALEVVAAARERGINLWADGDDAVQISVSEVTTDEHLAAVGAAFGVAPKGWAAASSGIPDPLRRTSEYLTHPVFHAHRSETAMLRYLRRLSDKDLALDRTMIPLGSCTMKLNATAEMESITWPEFADLHPFAPVEDAAGSARTDRSAGDLAVRDHRLRQGFAAAERGLAGGVRRAAGDPRLPPLSR